MSVKVSELENLALQLGFYKARHKGSHAFWKHQDGRSTTIPVHGNSEIGGWLLHQILSQLGVTEEALSTKNKKRNN
ncbi:type II toxin-antitoxin system HicA family toxin [Nostoc sp. CENA67]|uniref:Type II toxin-antitoxin system HicA family toxin n=1 Tax=Amazonocrinis nigriterrae CENA67 TaxID=2794033 RepID=A0A8J7L726_9NOST|nr:type II toxin-antitoxin system HicA family toxin [Amazonocrinis nigriterrae]MBH8562939.1 type II toxin-antitoxin system HicA family toxin [Amazonocrinis nigriterrae CENA67]